MRYLQQQPELIVLSLLAIPLSGFVIWKKKDKRLPLFTIFLWVVSASVLLLIYHPLMSHHIVLLALPIALLFSFSLYNVINIAPLSRFTPIAIALLTITVLIVR